MEKLKSRLFEKKGGFSILFVILIFIGIMAITGLNDVLVRSYTIGEVQSIMDVSGVSALQAGVDETKLRVEIFDVDKHVVESKYRRLIAKHLNGANKIDKYNFIEINIETYNSKFGLGVTSKDRPQAIIDSTMVIVVDNSQVFDLIPGSYKVFYNSKDNEYFDVDYLGKTEDGKVELLIRSVSRLVYR